MQKILSDNTIEAVAHYILKNKTKKIIVMAGAGISTSAGIPDFRSPGTGLYDNLQKYNLPHPEDIFDIEYFHENPDPFYCLAKELFPGNFKPTPTHMFIKLLCEKGLLLRCYTQNIDTLERMAGIAEEYLVEAHGSFATARCVGRFEDEGCRTEYSQEWLKHRINKDMIPSCENCPGLVKPDIVFFGENLPDRFYELLREDFRRCDLLIVLGTSLKVYPFAGLIDLVRPEVPRLLINRDRVGEDHLPYRGFDFDSKHFKQARDALYLGSCDQGATMLAKLLGMKADFDQLLSEISTEEPCIDDDILANGLKVLSLSKAAEKAPESSDDDDCPSIEHVDEEADVLQRANSKESPSNGESKEPETGETHSQAEPDDEKASSQ